MVFIRLQLDVWLLIAIFVIGELLVLAFFFYFKTARFKRSKPRVGQGAAGMLASAHKMVILEEVERLRDCGELDESLLREMTSEERALFEIALIDALTQWPSEERLRLRMALIRHGYDELCARRSMNETVSDRVRASTLLKLLRPSSQGNTGGLDAQMLNKLSDGEDEPDDKGEKKTKAHG